MFFPVSLNNANKSGVAVVKNGGSVCCCWWCCRSSCHYIKNLKIYAISHTIRICISFSFSIRTDLEGRGAISHLAITQARVQHSGVYTCSVSDTISQSLRLHIIDGEREKMSKVNNHESTQKITFQRLFNKKRQKNTSYVSKQEVFKSIFEEI